MKYPSTHPSLLERIRKGDEVSWNEFYKRYSPIIRYVGGLYRFTESECDDLVQDVMLKFFNTSGQFTYREGEVKFRSYFATILRSQAVDAIRRSCRERRGDPLPEDGMQDPFADVFLQEWRKVMLEEALDELRVRVDAATYQAFELYGMQKRPAGEVARTLHLSREQLYVAKSRCLKMLREIIERKNRFDGDLNLEI